MIETQNPIPAQNVTIGKAAPSDHLNDLNVLVLDRHQKGIKRRDVKCYNFLILCNVTSIFLTNVKCDNDT